MSVNTDEVDAIFCTAIEMVSPEERAQYVERACGADAGLRWRVEELLAAHFAAGDFLESPPVTGPIDGCRQLEDGPGTIIGPYKLLEPIGEGGMGVVFLAEQERPVHRFVALKIIKPGMDTRQVIARFEAERQALEMMDHPNIAKVLDAGTTGGSRDKGQEHRGAGNESSLAIDARPSTLDHSAGRPFFVMDLVRGVPITDYCDANRLTVSERLALFVQVCHAVEHAHQKGIIHRDLKPSNVLVAEYDGRPIPKIIDFGVAKATAQRLTQRTMFTESGQLIGTFEYMSPEQARFNQLDVDTRSDIYSLGVLLYELLTGSTPFERSRLETTPFDETLRIIREEEPPKPSTRLSSRHTPCAAADATWSVPATLATIVANRHTEAARLSKELRGELDWIVMKALEKDRNRRYETVGAMAVDIEHYLSDEPVSAVAPSRVYRASKFVKRNKLTVLAMTAVLTGLIAGIVGMTIGLLSQSRQRAIAERELAEAQLNLATALQSQENFAAAELLYRQVLTTDRETPEDRQRAARTLLRLAATVGQQGKPAESERLYREAIAAHRAAFSPGDPSIAHALLTFGIVLRDDGRWDEAAPLFQEAYEIRRGVEPADHRATGISALYLGHVLQHFGRYAEAEPLLRESIAEYQLAGLPNQWLMAMARLELGRNLNALGRRPEAEAELLAAVREFGSSKDRVYAEGALAALYTAWGMAEPGKGYDAKAREWFLRFNEAYLRPVPAVVESQVSE